MPSPGNLDHLISLYGPERGASTFSRLESLIERRRSSLRPPAGRYGPLTHEDVFLITYGDMVRRPGEPALATLAGFVERWLNELISGVHILPFFPFSSDDGFSVIDYRQVDPELGTWDHIDAIASSKRLMSDAVINHISARSDWFRKFRERRPPFDEYFISVDPGLDLSGIVRPRDLPLLTPVETSDGNRHVWTTFSDDQVDLNYANPEVLLEILDLLLFYIQHGAQVLRLDAVAFLWKKPGTPSIHLSETHRLIKLMRAVVEEAAPWVYLLTETNVPHEENLAYFGNGDDEAHMVYQFALPPLVLHTFLRGDASLMTEWASGLSTPSSRTAFFNFLASHDGVGLRPVWTILPEDQIETLLTTVEARGGGVSYRRTPQGRSAYELNITYLDALTDPEEFEADQNRPVSRFLTAQAIMLALAGVPAVYFHSLVGSRNDNGAVERTGRLRAINREKLPLQALEAELRRGGSLRDRVFRGYSALLRARRAHPAFNPYAAQDVLDLGPQVFALQRTASDRRRVLCLHEVSGRPASLQLDARPTVLTPVDLITRSPVDPNACRLEPYQTLWIGLD